LPVLASEQAVVTDLPSSLKTYIQKQSLQNTISRRERLLVVGREKSINKTVSELEALVQGVTFMHIIYNSATDTDAEILLIFTLQNVFRCRHRRLFKPATG
jgi:hypothetical protein